LVLNTKTLLYIFNIIISCLGSGSTGPFPSQGSSVSLSSDGNTLASGALGNNGGFGATWVFYRTGVTWAQQAGPLIGKNLFFLNNKLTFMVLTFRYWRYWSTISRNFGFFNQ
jgi:hypothetical protein